MRQADYIQLSALESKGTIPTYLIDVSGGEELLSTSGDVIVNDQLYTGGFVNMRSLQDWSQANLLFQPTVERLEWVTAGSWRRKSCRIYLLPGVKMKVYDHNYYGPDYLLQGEVYGDPILLLSGFMDNATFSGDGAVDVSIRHRSLMQRWAPPFRIGPPWCNHLPRAGEVITWGGERFIVETK